jgi:vanillate O-demethylase ferredoxin subunit
MTAADQLLDVVIARRVYETDDIVALELVAVNGGPLPPFEPGAHVDVHVGGGVVRQYSLCNDPAEHDRYRLAVLREAASRGGSLEIHRTFVAARAVQISPPRNRFPLVEDARLSVLIAGGIGVTPLMTMAHRLQRLGADFIFHYCTRSRDRAAFLGELARATFADRVRFHHDDGDAAQRFVAETALPSPQPGTHLYVCGPAGFMAYVTGAAKAAGWPADHVHTEYFSRDTDVDVTGDRFTVTAARSGVTVEVPPDRTIAQQLLDHGVVVPLACEQGICGTCITGVLEGVPDHRDWYQTDAEKATNSHIMVCCSRAKTALLVLDL